MHFLRALLLVLLAIASWPAAAVAPGEPAPTWSLISAEGTEIDFPRIAEGKPAVLALVGAGCTACAAVFPELQALREAFMAQELEIYVLLADPALDPASLADQGFDFVAVPEGQQAGAEYALEGPLALVLVDPRGLVAHVEAAAADAAAVQRLRAALAALTGSH